MKIYLASPLGFSEAGRAFYYGTLLPTLSRLGFAAVDPWVLTDPALLDAVRRMPAGPQRREAFSRLNAQMARKNAEAIDACDAMLAVLDGVDVDSGTAAEIGYAAAKGKPIVGYRGDFRLSGENEGTTVNLQVEFFIVTSGGEIVTELAEIPRALTQMKARMGKTS